jgi:hypothetical protein
MDRFRASSVQQLEQPLLEYGRQFPRKILSMIKSWNTILSHLCFTFLAFSTINKIAARFYMGGMPPE